MAQDKVRDRRIQQLKQVDSAIERLEKALQIIRKRQTREQELDSHLTGFYEEIDKLAKGKSLVEVTDLVVEQANDVIRDAKTIIEGDTYLNRIKEFVPAGNNPVYPDILVVIRAVQQSLARSRAISEQRRTRIAGLLLEGTTIRGALSCYVDYKVISPAKEQVEHVLDGNVAGKWFPGNYASGYHFDFDKLDRYEIDEYLSEDEVSEEPEE
jgi:septal ring factor EnvC (AmiA/AmiB activator)